MGAKYNKISIVRVCRVMHLALFEIRLGALLDWAEGWDDSSEFMRTKTELRRKDSNQDSYWVCKKYKISTPVQLRPSDSGGVRPVYDNIRTSKLNDNLICLVHKPVLSHRNIMNHLRFSMTQLWYLILVFLCKIIENKTQTLLKYLKKRFQEVISCWHRLLLLYMLS